MIQVPVVAGLTLCEQMTIRTGGGGRMSLEGIFHARRFSQYPTPWQSFTVYGALTAGVGEGVLKLTITRLGTNDTIYTYQRWYAHPPERLVPVNLEIRVKTCAFPAPGRYLISLFFDNELASERTLLIL